MSLSTAKLQAKTKQSFNQRQLDNEITYCCKKRNKVMIQLLLILDLYYNIIDITNLQEA